jgi:hypothetical protein
MSWVQELKKKIGVGRGEQGNREEEEEQCPMLLGLVVFNPL